MMTRHLLAAATTAALLLGAPATALAQEPSSAQAEQSLPEKVGSAIERGAQAAARGIERGARAAEQGIKLGVQAAARGVERGAQATARAAEAVANKVRPEPARPADVTDT